MSRTFFKYVVLSTIFVLLSKLINIGLNIRGLLYNSLSEKFTSSQIENIFFSKDKYEWVTLIFVPLIIFIKLTLVSSVLYIGLFFTEKEIDFKKIWSICLNAEFIFLFVPLLKFIWFYFFQSNYTLEDIQYFYPLSALNITGYKGIEIWLLYPLQTLNLFEIAYIIYLSYQIGKLTNTNADNGLKIVGYSYVPALLLWVCVVMFFTLNYS